MTILVPTDFSKHSKTAALYAARLAKKIGAELVLLNVVYGQASSRAMMVTPKLEAEMKKIANNELDRLVQGIKTEIKGKLDISVRLLTGFPVTNVVQRFLRQAKVDLVIMGTQGATGLQKVFIGSNAAAMIQDAVVPVVIVPQNAAFKSLKKIVYATDLDNMENELSAVCQFAKPFNATIDVVHVAAEDAPTKFDLKQMKSELARKMKYEKISFHLSKNDDVAEAIDRFIIAKKADMLVMFTHKLNFFEKLFSLSVTRKLAFHSYVPMLTFNKANLAGKKK